MSDLNPYFDASTGIATVRGQDLKPLALRQWLHDERLKELRLGPDEHGKPCSVQGELNLVSCEIKPRLEFKGVVFQGPVRARDARFLREVDWSGTCRFLQNLDLTDARFGGSFSLRDAEIHHGQASIEPEPENWLASPLGFPNKVALDRLRVDGTLDLVRLTTDAPLDLHHGDVKGDLRLCGAEIGGRIYLPWLHVGGELNACFSEPLGAVRPARFKGHVNLLEAKIVGQVGFDGAQLDGSLILQSAQIGGGVFCLGDAATGQRMVIGHNRDGESAWLSGIEVAGGVVFDGAELQGRLNLRGAQICGALRCGVDTATGHRMVLGQNQQGNSASLSEAKVTSGVCFTGADLRGSLDMNNAQVGGGLLARVHSATGQRTVIGKNKVGNSAWLGGATVSGSADFAGAELEGSLDLQGARLEGHLDCGVDEATGQRTVIGRNPEGDSAVLFAAKVTGGVLLSGAQLRGRLNMQNAQVGGSVICRVDKATGQRTVIDCDQAGESTSLSGAEVGGQIIFTGAELEGRLNLQNAQIGCNLFCTVDGGTGQRTEIGCDKEGVSAWLSGVKVSSSVEFRGAKLKGCLNLQNAQLSENLDCSVDTVAGHRAEFGKDRTGVSVSLVDAAVAGSVHFGGAELMGGLSLEDARIGGNLFFNPINGLRTCIAADTAADSRANLVGLSVGQAINFQAVEARCTLNMGRLVAGSLCARNLCVAGDLYLDASKVAAETQFGGAFVHGNWSAVSAAFAAGLSFGGVPLAREGEDHSAAYVGGKIELLQATVEGELAFANCQVGLASHPRRLEALKRFRSARLARKDTEGAVARAETWWATAVENEKRARAEQTDRTRSCSAEICQGNFAEFARRAAERMHLATAKLQAAELDLESAEDGLKETSGQTDRLRREFASERDEFVAARQNGKGETAARQAWEDAKDRSTNEAVLDLRHLTVKGRCQFNASKEKDKPAEQVRDRTEVWGTVNLQGAKIGGDLQLHRLLILGNLHAEDACIDGELSLLGTRIENDLNLRSATVNGQVFGELSDPAGEAPAVVCPDVGGEVKLNSAKLAEVRLHFAQDDRGKHPTDVDLERAQISKLTLTGTVPPNEPPFFRFAGFRFDELDLQHLSPGSSTRPNPELWQWVSGVSGLVAGGILGALLGDAYGAFALGKEWQWLGTLLQDGFGKWGRLGALLQHLFGANPMAIEWRGLGALAGAVLFAVLLTRNVAPYARLMRRKSVLLLEQMGKHRFDEAAYTSVETWLRNRGRDEEADDVYLRMRSREWWAWNPETDRSDPQFWHRLFKWALLHFTGYGVRPGRILAFWAVLFGVALVLFGRHESVKLKVSHASIAVYTNQFTNSPPQGQAPAFDETTGTLNQANGGPLQFALTQLGLTMTNAAGGVTSLPVGLTAAAGLTQTGAMAFEFKQRVPRDPNALGLPGYLRDTNFLTGWTRESDTMPSQSEWDGWAAAAMAWRMGLPMVDMFVRDDWTPSSEPVVKWSGFKPKYESVATCLKIANWVLVSLFLLSLSGLMKTRK